MSARTYEAMMRACYELGVMPPRDLPADGRWHPADLANDPKGKGDGRVKLFPDGEGGIVCNWKEGAPLAFWGDDGRSLTPAERSARDAKRQAAIKAHEAEEHERQANNARRNDVLLGQTVPVSDGHPVALYLRRRGLTGPVPANLRLHPSLTYWDGGDRGAWPAMVAPLLAPDGRLLALHRTYLTADGCKAPVPKVKKLTCAAGPLAGACIPLHEPRHGVIGIAEGIETAQAAHLASGLPTVAAYCAGNLAAYVWPADVVRIVVFADADPAGATAAQSLKARAMRGGLKVSVLTPSTPGADWCDVWAQRGAAAEGAA